jgi:hypothetical protein
MPTAGRLAPLDLPTLFRAQHVGVAANVNVYVDPA